MIDLKKISILLVAIILIVLSFSSCDKEENTIRIDDINIFISEEYVVEDRNAGAEWWKDIPGRNARKFFPSYDEIEYEYSDISFYVYAYAGLSFPDATFVLELKFDDSEKYEEAKSDIYTIYDYLEKPVKSEMPSCEYKVGDYLIKVLTEGKEEDSFPNFIYTICENDNENIIRYMFLYSTHQDTIHISDFVNGVKKHTNCQW